MPVRPLDEVLIDAMADAVEKGRVLFLIDGKDEIGAIARRTRRLAEDKVRDRLGADGANRLFQPSTNDWLLKTVTGGWLFFYPLEEIRPDDEVNDPAWVFWPTEKGEYKRIPYSEWQTLCRSGQRWCPTGKRATAPKKTGPKTAWDRLMDDDLDG